MKRTLNILLIQVAIVSTCLAGPVDSIIYGSFGKIMVYHPSSKPTSVALFVSGDGGWEPGVADMAKNVVNQGAMVLGIDIRSYIKSIASKSKECVYPAADFEDLSLMIQRKMQLPAYLKPILIGYSSGATLVYGILAQAPANTFMGALALGFCPDLQISRPLCKGTALTWHTLQGKKAYYLDATKGLTAPFIALNGLKDLTCPYAATKSFINAVPMAELVSLNKVGHGFSVTANWMPQFNSAYKKIATRPSFAQMKNDQNELLKKQNLAPLAGSFPLTLIPSAVKNDLPVLFFISGDGGWTSFDHDLSETIAKAGMPVIGLDAQKYFWNQKSPEQTAADISKALTHYMQQWDKKEVVLAGFSFGASVIPFVVEKLPEELQKKVRGVISLSPDEEADFEIHIMDMLNIGKNKGDFRVLPEILKIKPVPVLCIYGSTEDNDFKTKLTQAGIKTVTVPGGHHYNNDYNKLTKIILESVK